MHIHLILPECKFQITTKSNHFSFQLLLLLILIRQKQSIEQTKAKTQSPSQS